MPLTLFSNANNYQQYKAQIAAALAGVDMTLEEVKTVHDKSPTNKGPVLDTGSGLIFQSNAIMRYLARLAPASLAYGETLVGSGQVDQWIDFCLNELEPARGVWLFPVLKMCELNMKSYNQAKKGVTTCLKILDKHLRDKTYMVGFNPTIADVAIFSALLDMYSMVFAPNFVKNYTNVTRWFNTVAHHPAFAGVVGEVKFAEQEQKAVLKKKAQPKKKVQQQAKPKEKKAPKPKNPLELLPKSTMVLDVVKKLFFNQRPFNPKFFEQYWTEIMDYEGYCFYKIEYQYNEDNTVFWQTQNQIGMFVQRLDSLRKYGFGCILLSGENEETGPWRTEGCFLYRGLGIPAEMMDNPSSEYYKFTKLDVATAENKALVESFFQGDKVLSLIHI